MAEDIRILRGQRIMPDPAQTFALAGYKDGDTAQGQKLFQQLLPQVRRLIQPKAALAFTDTMIWTVLTLGPAVDGQKDRFFQDGAYTEGLLFNAMADSCLLAFEEQVLSQLKGICREKGIGIAERLEAGSQLPLSAVAEAVQAVDGRRTLRVSVTDDMVLKPEKTMATAYNISADASVFHMRHDCSSCAASDCTLRKEAPAEDRHVTCPAGVQISSYLQQQGIAVPLLCGGKGMCGKCRVQVVEGDLPVTAEDARLLSRADLAAGWRLSCKAVAKQAVTVRVPAVETGSFAAVGAAPQEQEDTGLHDDGQHAYGIAVDVGSTTLAVSLVDRTAGKTVHTVTAVNSQRQFGTDVVSRIQAANKGKGRAMQQGVRRDIGNAVRQLLKEYPQAKGRIDRAAVAGNTTMLHLLMGWDCRGLGAWPFHPVSLGGETYSWADVFGPKRAIPGCSVTLLPGISTYVGGDITAGIWQCGLTSHSSLRLLVDLGTNGEMAIGNDNKLFVASTSAGPALEGASLTWGTGSVSGAICGVTIERSRAKVRTIDGAVPVGICGTGVIEGMAELVRNGLVDETGKLKEPYFHQGFTLASTLDYRRITLNQKDIRAVQLAKSAVRAGIETLLAKAGASYEDIAHVYLAGGFGYYLNPEKAAVIGLLPAALTDRTTAVGNTSLAGAAAVLTSDSALTEMQALGHRAEEIVLANESSFQDEYIHYINF